jgi:uncharacterized protein (DUF2164 family)
MAIALSKEQQAAAISSIERYFRADMDEPIGNMAAAALLGFFLAEIAPVVYNQGVADAQSKLQAWVGELDIEVQEEEFAYWKKGGRG